MTITLSEPDTYFTTLNDIIFVGHKYLMTFPQGQTMIAILSAIRIQSTFPDDCIFTFISGDSGLADASPVTPNFALPQHLVKKIKFKEQL
jgi:hypothetical protein